MLSNLTVGFDSPWQLIVIQSIVVAQLQHCAICRPTAPLSQELAQQ